MTEKALTLTLAEEHDAQLQSAIFSDPDLEGAAYLLCGQSETTSEIRLLSREVFPVADEHYLVRERDRLSITSASYASAAKKALSLKASVLFVHSHPTGYADFSKQDDLEEPKLMEFLVGRIPDRQHGSVMFPAGGSAVGRVWQGDTWSDIKRIRTIGRRFHFLDATKQKEALPEFFDRQVRAFGPDIQRLLGQLHVGIVGVGGTGSSVYEQLVRLGLGKISIYDAERFERSNVNRVYGSDANDAGELKTKLAKRNADRIGLGTSVESYGSITELPIAMTLRDCDVIFGCTDKQAPRGILVRLALWYHIPVIDVGVKVDSADGVLKGVDGRVTVLMPGESCLFCRKRIDPHIIALEMGTLDEWKSLADEEYAPELEGVAPAVIPFTTSVAAQAVSELLQRLTSFMGPDRASSETLLFFHEPSIRTNRFPPSSDCVCSQRQHWGKGDRRTFLDLTWPESTS